MFHLYYLAPTLCMVSVVQVTELQTKLVSKLEAVLQLALVLLGGMFWQSQADEKERMAPLNSAAPRPGPGGQRTMRRIDDVEVATASPTALRQKTRMDTLRLRLA